MDASKHDDGAVLADMRVSDVATSAPPCNPSPSAHQPIGTEVSEQKSIEPPTSAVETKQTMHSTYLEGENVPRLTRAARRQFGYPSTAQRFMNPPSESEQQRFTYKMGLQATHTNVVSVRAALAHLLRGPDPVYVLNHLNLTSTITLKRFFCCGRIPVQRAVAPMLALVACTIANRRQLASGLDKLFLQRLSTYPARSFDLSSSYSWFPGNDAPLLEIIEGHIAGQRGDHGAREFFCQIVERICHDPLACYHLIARESQHWIDSTSEPVHLNKRLFSIVLPRSGCLIPEELFLHFLLVGKVGPFLEFILAIGLKLLHHLPIDSDLLQLAVAIAAASPDHGGTFEIVVILTQLHQWLVNHPPSVPLTSLKPAVQSSLLTSMSMRPSPWTSFRSVEASVEAFASSDFSLGQEVEQIRQRVQQSLDQDNNANLAEKDIIGWLLHRQKTLDERVLPAFFWRPGSAVSDENVRYMVHSILPNPKRLFERQSPYHEIVPSDDPACRDCLDRILLRYRSTFNRPIWTEAFKPLETAMTYCEQERPGYLSTKIRWLAIPVAKFWQHEVTLSLLQFMLRHFTVAEWSTLQEYLCDLLYLSRTSVDGDKDTYTWVCTGIETILPMILPSESTESSIPHLSRHTILCCIEDLVDHSHPILAPSGISYASDEALANVRTDISVWWPTTVWYKELGVATAQSLKEAVNLPIDIIQHEIMPFLRKSPM